MPYGRYKSDYWGGVDFDRLTRERRAKAKKAMEKYNLDALICFSAPNIRYLTTGRSGQTGIGGYRYAVYPITGEPIYHEQGMQTKGIQQGLPDLKCHYSISMPPELIFSNLPAYKYQVGKFVELIKEELKEGGVLNGKVGVDGIEPIVADALREAGINLSMDGRAAMAEARLIKTVDEIELLRQGCVIVEGCYARVKEIVKPGLSEKQIWGEVCKAAFDQGAEAIEGGHVSSGSNSYPIGNSLSDRIIRPGDIILIDIYNVSYHGYRTCYYRDFSVGEPTQKQKDAWKRAVEFTYETINLIKPGVSTKELVKNWPKAVDFGYENEDDATMAQWAHGIGLTQYESPVFSRIWSLDYPEEIQEGMVFAVETQWPTGEITGAYPCGQCLRIEEEVVVTKSGCDVLSQWPIDEITVCW